MNMRRELWIFGLLAISVLLAWCGQQLESNIWENANTGAIQTFAATASFKAEYEALNDDQHPHMIVPETLNIQTLNFEKTQALINSGNGILFFGFPSCPWCRNLLPELFVAMEKSGVKDLYYYNPKAIRDEKELLSWTIVTKKEANTEYQWLLDKIGHILPAYRGLENPEIKRLYVPTVLIIKDGEIIGHHFDTLEEQTDPHTPLNDQQKLKLQTILQELISPLADTVCGIPEENSEESYSC